MQKAEQSVTSSPKTESRKEEKVGHAVPISKMFMKNPSEHLRLGAGALLRNIDS